MRSFIFDRIDYFIHFIANNYENIDASSANNMNIRSCDSNIVSADITLSQLCKCSNVIQACIISDGEKVATIKDVIPLSDDIDANDMQIG